MGMKISNSGSLLPLDKREMRSRGYTGFNQIYNVVCPLFWKKSTKQICLRFDKYRCCIYQNTTKKYTFPILSSFYLSLKAKLNISKFIENTQKLILKVT